MQVSLPLLTPAKVGISFYDNGPTNALWFIGCEGIHDKFKSRPFLGLKELLLLHLEPCFRPALWFEYNGHLIATVRTTNIKPWTLTGPIILSPILTQVESRVMTEIFSSIDSMKQV